MSFPPRDAIGGTVSTLLPLACQLQLCRWRPCPAEWQDGWKLQGDVLLVAAQAMLRDAPQLLRTLLERIPAGHWACHSLGDAAISTDPGMAARKGNGNGLTGRLEGEKI
eukprot:Skav223924  [mRNA]  locus=scaffold2593:357296:357622:- [translate_table: standard]